MKASKNYKRYSEKIKGRITYIPSYQVALLIAKERKVKRHYDNCRNLESKTDNENRISICNGDQRFVQGNYQARLNIEGDSVYQLLKQAYSNKDKTFNELRKQKPYRYKNNSRQNPQAKRHNAFYEDFLFYGGLIKLEARTMDNETYNKFIKKGLMFAYEQSKENMEKIDVRKKEIIYFAAYR